MASLFYEWTYGDIAYTKRGWGEPILLLHNMYPGASHEEFEHNIAALSQHFTVYAPDLLGYGESSAPRIRYTANTYTTLIRDFMNEVIEAPTHIVATGLTCAYVADIAVWRKEAVRSIVMVCPRSEPTGLDMPRWVAPLHHFVISSPMLGNGLYDTISSPYEVRAYLRYCFHQHKHVTREKIERLVRNAAKPGGVFPYASLLTGYLDSHLLKTLPHVDVPVMLLWGRQANPTPVEHSVRLAAMLRHGRLQVVENAGSWVHNEQSKIVNELIHEFAEGWEFAAASVTG